MIGTVLGRVDCANPKGKRKLRRHLQIGSTVKCKRRGGDSPSPAGSDSPASRRTTRPWCVTSDLSTDLGNSASAPKVNGARPAASSPVHRRCTTCAPRRLDTSLSQLAALDSAAASYVVQASAHSKPESLGSRAAIGQPPSTLFDKLQQRVASSIILLDLGPRVKGNILIQNVLGRVRG